MTLPVIYILDPCGGSIRAHNPAMPHLFADDAGITRGDGVVETLLVHEGRVANLARHGERFRRSAASLDLPEPDVEQWERASRQAVEEWGSLVDARLRWFYTRGRPSTGRPSAWLTVETAEVPSLKERIAGVSVLTASRGYSLATGEDAAPWHGEPAKTINYAASMAALRWAREQGAQDVLFTEPGTGLIQEATTAAVLVVTPKKKLRTPRPGLGVLRSTSQQALWDLAAERGWKTKERDLSVEDLLGAESVWLLSSVRRGVRVNAINGQELPTPENAAEVAALIEEALTI